MPSSEASGKYCCRAKGTTDKTVVSDNDCTGSSELGKITGKVTNFLTLRPVKTASICTDPSHCYGSTDDEGNYEIRVPFGREYTLYAMKPGFKDSTPIPGIKVTSDSDASKIWKDANFVLEEKIDPCKQELPPVTYFVVNHTLGDVKKIKLAWGRPNCTKIIGFEITKTLMATPAQGTPVQPAPLPLMEPRKNSYVDSDVKYDQTYKYEIKVIYSGVGQLSQGNISTIKVGQQQCEGMYRNSMHVQFCAVNITSDKLVDIKQCDKENKALKDNKGADLIIESCNPDTHVCSGPNAAGLAKCKKLNECGTRKQEAFPFGLYFQKDRCLGMSSSGTLDYSNNCYYDYYKSEDGNPQKVHGAVEIFDDSDDSSLITQITHQVTPFNKCLNCPTKKDSEMSCFNYRSEFACTTDSCNLGFKANQACSWINASYSELGLGYCYPENYTKNDRCSLCSETNDVFFNTRCTQDICSKLGRCFSTEYEASCRACNSDTRCEDLKTRRMCVGNEDPILGQEFNITDDASIAYSKDICGLGRCKWDALLDRCYKDGNDDTRSADDCTLEELGNIDPSLSIDKCKKDNNATITTLKYPSKLLSIGGTKIGGTNEPDALVFTVGGSEKNAYSFSYCIDKEDIQNGINNGNKCYPGTVLDGNIVRGGLSFYGTATEAIITRNTLKSVLEEQGYTDSSRAGIFYIRFFSTDKFYNQEEVKSIPVYIDIWGPKLTSDHILNINMEGTPVNKDTKSQIFFNISSDEEVKCTAEKLEKKGSTILLFGIKGTTDEKGELYYSTAFNSVYNVTDGLYKYTVTCEDKSHNVGTILYDDTNNADHPAIHVDAFSKVTVNKPKISNTVSSYIFPTNTILFEVQTTDPSICTLIRTPSEQPATESNPVFAPDKNNPLIQTLSFPVTVSNTDYVSGKPFSSQAYPGSAGNGYGVQCRHESVTDTESFTFSVDRTPPNVTLGITGGKNGEAKEIVQDEGFYKEYGNDRTLTVLCNDMPIGGSLQVFGAKPNSEKICQAEIWDTEACKDLQKFEAKKTLSVNSKKRICFTCEDNGGNVAPVKCGEVYVDKEGPIFRELTISDENNPYVNTLVRKIPSKFYTATIQSSEKLKEGEDATISFRIRHHNGPVVDYRASLKAPYKIDQLWNQYEVYYETEFAVPMSEEFNGLDSSDTIEIIVSGKDKFGNPGILKENYTVDSTIPKPPTLNEFFQASTRYSTASLFEQTGFEGDKIPDRNIILEFGNRPNIIRLKTLNINGITLTTLADLEQKTVDLISSGARTRDTLKEGESKTLNINGKNYLVKSLAIAKDAKGETYAEFSVNNEKTSKLTANKADKTKPDTFKFKGGYEIYANRIILDPRKGDAVEFTLITYSQDDVACADQDGKDYYSFGITKSNLGNFTVNHSSIIQLTSEDSCITAESYLQLDSNSLKPADSCTGNELKYSGDLADGECSISKYSARNECAGNSCYIKEASCEDKKLKESYFRCPDGCGNGKCKTAAQAQASMTQSAYSTPDPKQLGKIRLESVLEGDKLKIKSIDGEELTLKDIGDVNLAGYYLEFEDIKQPSRKFYNVKEVLDDTKIDKVVKNITRRLEAKAAKEEAKKAAEEARELETKAEKEREENAERSQEDMSKNSKQNEESNNGNSAIPGAAVLDFITGRVSFIDFITGADTALPTSDDQSATTADPAGETDGPTAAITDPTSAASSDPQTLTADPASTTDTSASTTANNPPRKYILSSPALTAVTAEKNDPNAKFISLDKTLYGLENVQDEEFDAQSTYKRDFVVNVYEKASPLGWFNASMQLQEGSTWFYAYAIDENNNLGLPTAVKKIIIDTMAPDILHYGPAENSKISANLGANIFATFTDFNSGIVRETAVLEIDDQIYTCEDKPKGVECLGTKTFTIRLTKPLAQQGLYKIKASAADKLGNRKEHSWQFVVNNDAPSEAIPETPNGLCPENDRCYINNKTPEFILKYDTLPAAEITAQFNSADPIAALVENINNYLKLQLDPADLKKLEKDGLDEGDHTITLSHKDTDKATGITAAEYPNLVRFVVDTISPGVTIDELILTNSKSINITGTYTEQNVYEIRFSGDILHTEPLTFRELPTDIVDGNTNLFIKNVELDIANISKLQKDIIITVVDKANNSITTIIRVNYDIIPPELANITVEVTNPQNRILEYNNSYYKTNDLKVRIKGQSSKPLEKMLLSAGSVIPVDIDITGLKFEAELDLGNTLSTTSEEHVLLQAEDREGNKQYYFLLIQLDVSEPEVDVKII
ncbi:hypothetical protein J4410_05665 [Candidatus Woesearchaeota archaeon]|nr:hypothetical protein [Candidatus Woesearchaeota archaeon]